MTELWAALVGASELWAALAGAALTGIFAIYGLHHTTKQANKRAQDDRDERAQMREEDRTQQFKQRALDRGLPIVEEFVQAVTQYQDHADYLSPHDEESLGAFTDLVRHLLVTRNLLALYFPDRTVRHVNMVIERVEELPQTLELGEDGRIVHTEEYEQAQADITAALSLLCTSVQLNLGFVIHVEPDSEYVRRLMLMDEDAPNVQS